MKYYIRNMDFRKNNKKTYNTKKKNIYPVLRRV